MVPWTLSKTMSASMLSQQLSVKLGQAHCAEDIRIPFLAKNKDVFGLGKLSSREQNRYLD